MEFYAITKSLHYLVGVLALTTFWIAAFTRKGSPLHKAVGKLYLLAMCAIVVTAMVFTGYGVMSDPGPMDAFLAYLVVITATSCWLSWRAIRDKRDFARYTGPVYRVLAVLNLLAGAGIFTIGIAIGSLLLTGFSMVGFLLGFGMLRLRRRGPAHPQWWRQEHMNAMLGNGVATHIAFLSIGLPRILPTLAGPTLQMLAWFGPLLVAFVLQIWLGRKYAVPKSLPARPADAMANV